MGKAYARTIEALSLTIAAEDSATMHKLLYTTFLAMLCIALPASAMTPEEAKMITTAAQRGNDGSQVLLAVMYLNGDGGYAKDDKRAAYWFEQAAQQGNGYAQKMLGDLYAQGRGVPQNLKLTADWREKAAKRGNIQAQLLLGKMYLKGEGVEKNEIKAEEWLNRAAIAGDSEAQFLMGKIYHSRSNSAHDQEVAGNWLAKSAAQGYEDAIRLLHFMENIGYEAEENFFQRKPHIRKLAEDGDAEAQYQLAIRYESGASGVKPDYEKSLYWFKQAANNGHVMAMKSLAHIYRQGLDGVSADPKQADYWETKAAGK
jgi:TPR repeat protein